MISSGELFRLAVSYRAEGQSNIASTQEWAVRRVGKNPALGIDDSLKMLDGVLGDGLGDTPY